MNLARFARKVIKWDFFAWFSNTVPHYGKSTLPLCISSQPSLWNWLLSTLLSAVNLSLVIWHEGSLWVLLKTVTITSWVYQISKKRGIESRGTQVHTYANLGGWPGCQRSMFSLPTLDHSEWQIYRKVPKNFLLQYFVDF